MSQHPQYSNEELGINPDRERRIIRIVIGTMVTLLILGMLLMLAILALDAARYEEPAPEQPFMEFSAVHHELTHTVKPCHG